MKASVMNRFVLTVCALLVAASMRADATLTIPGADGSDGIFNPTASIEIDLSQATTAQWDSPSPSPGKGVYDPQKWAVVFKYSEVNIPSGVVVTFKNNHSNAPVVWLVTGNVVITGVVNLDGQNASNTAKFAKPGPGGFRGAAAGTATSSRSGSFGVGGAYLEYGGGSYGARGGTSSGITYGNPQICPLIGGSGGAAGAQGLYDGGAGGGAILIACQESFALNGGTVRACGGSSVGSTWTGYPTYHNYCGAGGSGGAIRIVAESFSGNSASVLLATGGGSAEGVGGSGRIRIERADDLPYLGSANPDPSRVVVANPPCIWPDGSTPVVRIARIGGVAVPPDPKARFGSDCDVRLNTSDPVTIRLEATNVPTSWNVAVRLVRTSGEPSTVSASLVSGDGSTSVWEAEIPSMTGAAAIQVHANKP